MADVERRLGFRPRFGAFDAAFDAFYVYEHFRKGQTDPDFAFAAVPFSQRGGHRLSFDPNGLPSCKSINLRALHRVRRKKTTRPNQPAVDTPDA